MTAIQENSIPFSMEWHSKWHVNIRKSEAMWSSGDSLVITQIIAIITHLGAKTLLKCVPLSIQNGTKALSVVKQENITSAKQNFYFKPDA